MIGVINSAHLPSTPITPPDEVGLLLLEDDALGVLRGCSGCVGSVESVSEAPKRSCASVASITVRIQSQVGFSRFSTYI